MAMMDDFLKELEQTAISDTDGAAQVVADGIETNNRPTVPLADRAVCVDQFDVSQASACQDLADVDVQCRDEDEDGDRGAWESEWSDMYAMAYKIDPTIHERVIGAIQKRRDFVEALSKDPNYDALHSTTMLCGASSAIAASSFMRQMHAMPDDEGDEGGDDSDSPPNPDADKTRKHAARQAAHKATKQATRDVEQFEAMCEACGNQPGAMSPLDTQRALEQFRRFQYDPMLRRILELAGRYKMLAEQSQQSKPIHGRDEIIGVETGNDLSKVCPVELGRLATPELQLDFMRRYVERGLFQYETASPERATKGPIIVAVDESGSMGEMSAPQHRIENAKALTLALLWVARRQGRKVWLIRFDTEAIVSTVDPTATKAANDRVVIEFLSQFKNGGTRFDAPTVEITKILTAHCDGKHADVVFVTDGESYISNSVVEDFHAAKTEVGAKCTGIAICCRDSTRLDQLCDVVHHVNELVVGTEAVGDVLSL